MKTKRIGFNQLPDGRIALSSDPSTYYLIDHDFYIENMVIETIKNVNSTALQNNDTHFLQVRPGTKIANSNDDFASLLTGAGTTYTKGIYFWKNALYVVNGENICSLTYSVAPTECTSLGNRLTTFTNDSIYTSMPVFAETGGGTPRLAVQMSKNYLTNTPTSELWVVSTAGAATKVVAGGLPGTCVPGVAHLNGWTLVYTKDKKLYNSDLNNPTTGYTTYISSTSYADQAMAVRRYLNYVACFNENSLEMFYDAGNAVGSPLALVEGSTLNIGCAAPNSIAPIQNTLVWLAKTSAGGIYVGMLDKLEVIKISNAALEKVLNNPNFNIQDAYGVTLEYDGHSYYILNLNDQVMNKSFVFDFQSKTWTFWSYDPTTQYNICGATLFTGNTSIGSASSPTTYTIFTNQTVTAYLDSASWGDIDAAGFGFKLRLPRIDFGISANKFMRRLEIVGDNDISAAAGGHELYISWSDDDNVSSTLRSVFWGNRTYLCNLGRFSKRSITIQNKTTVPKFRMYAIEVALDVGSYGI